MDELAKHGTLRLQDSSGGVTLGGARVSGLVYVDSNAGGANTVAGNSVNGSLSCTGNNPAPGDGGTVNTAPGTAAGQCAGLAVR